MMLVVMWTIGWGPYCKALGASPAMGGLAIDAPRCPSTISVWPAMSGPICVGLASLARRDDEEHSASRHEIQPLVDVVSFRPIHRGRRWPVVNDLVDMDDSRVTEYMDEASAGPMRVNRGLVGEVPCRTGPLL
jgi:hypothetical protein